VAKCLKYALARHRWARKRRLSHRRRGDREKRTGFCILYASENDTVDDDLHERCAHSVPE